ncbi:hypothetical protein H2200_007508 [Cladophialophora chaetospira]|uniref:Major facilitator superfamily (MFS) profile domain-containing protein n=1 Tax=Cladophialophora chaetospira TaxID=386627 RepID=A0AA38X7X3_9EURO|nr:hypothetical protein H2200_007508 [Cladophialophora chaetospira]
MLEEQNGHAADAHDTSIDGQKSPYDHEMSSHDHNNHDASSRLTPLKFFAILALAANYVGSNINSYFIGLVLLFMKADLKLNSTESSWIPVASSLTFACTAPCVGYLQDIFGRRNTLILGGLAGILGNGLMAGAHSFVTALIGSTFTGLANSLGELTAIAAYGQPPRSHRLLT